MGEEDKIPPTDAKLYNHFKKCVHQLIIDAAANETLSGRQMKAGVNMDGEKVLTPNLQFVTLDKAHCTLRIMKRPFRADSVLGQLLEDFVLGKESLVHVVDYSQVIKNVFAALVSREEDTHTGRIRNLGYAKHRFNSIQKPLSRLVLHISAMVGTATWIRRHRAGRKEANVADAFLQKLNAETYMLLALMADAMDECMLLNRLCDSEDVDKAVLVFEVGRFTKHLNFLFVQRGKACQISLAYLQSNICRIIFGFFSSAHFAKPVFSSFERCMCSYCQACSLWCIESASIHIAELEWIHGCVSLHLIIVCFLLGGALGEGTYANFALEEFKKVKTFVTRAGTKSFGDLTGVAERTIDAALKRMSVRMRKLGLILFRTFSLVRSLTQSQDIKLDCKG